MFAQGSFTSDANATPEMIARKRAYIAAMMPKFGKASYVGEGLGQLATGVMVGRQNRKLDSAESAGRQSAADLFSGLVGKGSTAPGSFSVLGAAPMDGASSSSAPMPPLDPNSPHALGNDAMAALGKPAKTTPATPEAIKAGLVARGLPEHVAEGFVMNFQDESGLNPGINEANPIVPGSRGGFGLYQLTGPRRKAYEAYAAERGVPVDDVDAQLDFMMMEMQGPEANAASVIMSTKTPGEAGAAIVNEFLRPSPEYAASRAAKYAGGSGMPSGAQPGAPAPAGANGATPGIPTDQLLAALSNPWLSEQERSVLASIYDQQVQAGDPMRQMELQKAQMEVEAMRNPAAKPPEELTTRMLLMEQAGLDPQSPEGQNYLLTGELPEAPEAGYRPMTPQEVQQLGLPPGPYQVGPKGEIKPIGGGGTNVTVNNVPGTPPSDEALRKKLMEAEGVTWGEYLKAGTTASGMSQDMELLSQVIEMAPQGPVVGRMAEMFPGVSDAAGVFQSVVKRVAPSLRVEGSGSQSDIEYNGFLQSLPSLSNRPEANRAIASFLQSKAQINMDRAAVISQYQNGEISAADARKSINEIDSRSIMTPEMGSLLGQMDGGAAPTEAGPPPDGITPDEWNAMSPEDRALWQN